MKSLAGLGGYLTSVSLDWPLVAAVTSPPSPAPSSASGSAP